MRLRVALTIGLMALFAWGASTALAADAKYVGAPGCTARCHNKKEKDGDQKGVWLASKHAKAYQNLGSAEAKQKAKDLGVAGNPQSAKNCLACHTTGFGAPAAQFDSTFKKEDGVQCEACHGPGEHYKAMKTMKSISEERGPDKKGKSETAVKTGLHFPTEETCKRCHVQEITLGGETFKNPSYKEFAFQEFYDKMKHPRP
jgi:hypothetical protein